ncbi:MAG TPA: cupredoxin domain-containing protein [Nitrososphaeraceae archaeon]
MTDWDLLTPGIGLTVIGMVGVGISLAGIAQTFLEGMHAVSLLAMFIGLIILVAGIFKDGFPSSPKAKSATFITLGFLVTFGLAGAVTVSTQVPSIFAYIGLMLIISIPATVLSVASYKRTPYFNALAIIFIGAAIVGGSTFYVFGLVSPKSTQQELAQGQNTSSVKSNGNSSSVLPANLTKVTILPGASAQGNPNYDPNSVKVAKNGGVQWTNKDNVPHTVTSLKDDGKTFDSSIIKAGGTYILNLSPLAKGEYGYFCTLHPYMRGLVSVTS